MSWDIEKTGRVAVVRMNTNAMNVMNEDFFSDLEEAFDALSESFSECPVVLASSQRAFSAGLDLKYHYSLFSEGDEEKIRGWYERFRGALFRVFTYEKPVVAAVGGHAVGGGLVLALCCDYGVCVDAGAKFGLNEVFVGIPLPCAMARIILHSLGTGTAERAVTRGVLHGTETALEIGFFDEARPSREVIPRSVEIAGQYVARVLPAYCFSKTALRRGVVAEINRECGEIDAELPRVLCGREVLESMAGALETLKRKGKAKRREEG